MNLSSNAQIVAAALLVSFALVGGCQSGGSKTSTEVEQPDTVVEAPLVEPELPRPEPSRQKTTRLLRLEQALDNWYIAAERQEYGRKESLEALLLEFSRENMDAIISDLKHGSPRYRRVMAAALGFSSDARAVKPLMDALTDPYYEVVQHALMSLYHLTRPLPPKSTKAKHGSQGAWRNKQADAVVVRRPLAPSLVDAEKVASYLQHHRPEVRCNAALALRPLVLQGKAPNSVVLALINTTEDIDDRTRVHAVAALGATRAPDATPHLVKALSDRTALVRIRAALGLARIGDVQVAPYLIEVLDRKEETAEVKGFVARALSVLLAVSGEDALSTDAEVWRKHATDRGIILR